MQASIVLERWHQRQASSMERLVCHCKMVQVQPLLRLTDSFTVNPTVCPCRFHSIRVGRACMLPRQTDSQSTV